MKFTGVIFVVVAILTDICRGQPKISHTDPAITLMTKNQMDFTLKLFKHSSTTDKSHLLSPIAIISALSILYQGAAGDTQHEMMMLGGGSSAQIFNNQAHYTLDSLNIGHEGSGQRNDFIIGKSTKLWVQQSIALNSIFNNDIVMFHGVTVEDENFSQDEDDDLVQKASQWLSDKAYNRANDIVFINFNFSLFLINELHLQSRWKYRFVITYPEHFSVSPSQKINVTMMGRTAEIPYYEDQSVQVISLPLDKPDLDMIIILPKERCGLAKVEMELTKEKLLDYFNALDASDKSKIMITIPKFFERKYVSLSDGLESMGLQSMFTQSANFNGISDQPLSVTKHIGNLASLQITENGINADSSTDDNDRASTSTDNTNTELIDTLFMPMLQAFDASHPFLYFISDKRKNILWIGRYMGNDEDAFEVESDDETPEECEDMETNESTGYYEASEDNERFESSEYGEFSGGQGKFSGIVQIPERGQYAEMVQLPEQDQYIETMMPLPGQAQYVQGQNVDMIQLPEKDQYVDMIPPLEQGQYAQGQYVDMIPPLEQGQYAQGQYVDMIPPLEQGQYAQGQYVDMIQLPEQGQYVDMIPPLEQGQYAQGQHIDMIPPQEQGYYAQDQHIDMIPPLEQGQYVDMIPPLEQGQYAQGQHNDMIPPLEQGQDVNMIHLPEQDQNIQLSELDEFAGNTNPRHFMGIDFEDLIDDDM